jgi:hypothetical protein
METKKRPIEVIDLTKDEDDPVPTKSRKIEKENVTEDSIEDPIEIQNSGYFELLPIDLIKNELFSWVGPWLIFLAMTCWRFRKSISKEKRGPKVLLLLDALRAQNYPQWEILALRYVPLVVRIRGPFYFETNKYVRKEAKRLTGRIGEVNKNVVDAIRFGSVEGVKLLLDRLNKIVFYISNEHHYAVNLAYFCGKVEMIHFVKNRYPNTLRPLPSNFAILGNGLDVIKQLTFEEYAFSGQLIVLNAIMTNNEDKVSWLKQQGVKFDMSELKKAFLSRKQHSFIERRSHFFE